MKNKRDICQEKLMARSKLLVWGLGHTKPEDKQLLADVDALILLCEIAAYRDGMQDGMCLASALAQKGRLAVQDFDDRAR